MLSTSSQDYMAIAGAGSSGALLPLSMQPLVQDLFDFPAFSTVDYGKNCSVQFLTKIEATGPVNAALPLEAIQRMIAIFIVQRLTGEALKSSCELLADTYRWSTELKDLKIHRASDIKVAGKTKLKISKAKPVIFEED